MAPALPDLDLTLPPLVPEIGPKPSGRWGDLRLRIVSAAVLVPVGLGCLWLAPWSWALLLTVAAVGMGLEWVALCGARRDGLASVALGVALVGITALALGGAIAAAALLVLGACLVVWLAAAGQRHRGTIAAGCVYLGVPLVAVIWLRDDRLAGFANVLFVLLVIWCGDIGAYAAGRWFGGPKLAPTISPGKTWSGAIGGLLASVAAGLATSLAFGGAGPMVCLVAALVAIAGQAGDLLESAIKRWAGVKDSGRSIPGHGGLLDRLDAVLTAAPVAALFAWWVGQGVYLWR